MTSLQTPIHVLTGFLGSGKTTLLNSLLKQADYQNTLVIVNEFGEISIDHHLVETSTETIFELANGCLCCSIRGELVETLLSLDLARFQRVIVETTGIADPLPIFQSLMEPEIVNRGLQPASIVCVFDNTRGESLLDDHPETTYQLAVADTVFISQTDATPDTRKSIRLINEINPGATIVDDYMTLNLNDYPIIGEPHAKQKPYDMSPASQHNHEISSVYLKTDQPKPLHVFAGFMHHLSNVLGKDFLRAKGFAYCVERELPFLLQMSGYILHDPIPMDEWKETPNQTRLIIIGKKLDHTKIQSIFNSFFDVADLDTPDRTALIHNPLIVHGM